MEGLVNNTEGNNVEDFDNLKNRIEKSFKEGGSPEELKSEIKKWRFKKAEELDKSRSNSNEQEVSFLLESAQLFGTIEQFDDSWDCLDGAWQIADQRGDTKLKATVEYWMDTIHSKKE
jgi:hypothetical protein